jgi:membrane-anchored mycosin MYCP
VTGTALLGAVLALAPLAEPGPAAGLRQVTECVAPGGDAGADGAGGLAPVPGPVPDGLHTLARGAGQRIAVIDTGVSPHPRLPNLRGGGDYLTGGDGLDDCDGHGTAVAGLLGAAAGPDDDVVGIAPDAEIIAIRQLSPSFTVQDGTGQDGTGQDGTGARPAGDTDTLAAALLRAVELRASVVTVSEAVCLEPARAAVVGRSLREALRRAAAADVLVVAAAGNAGGGNCTGRGDEVSLPGAAAWVGGDPDARMPGAGVLDDGVLTVGAVGPDDAAAPFTVPGPWVDVAALGTGLRSLGVGSGLTAQDLQGTSFAVPLVAGLAALVRERNPGLSAAEVAERLADTARRPAGAGAGAARIDSVGYGVVDPLAALSALPASAVPDPTAGSLLQPASALPSDPSTTGIAIAAGMSVVLVGALFPLLRRLRRTSLSEAARPPRPGPPRGPAPDRRAAAAGPPPVRRPRR